MSLICVYYEMVLYKLLLKYHSQREGSECIEHQNDVTIYSECIKVKLLCPTQSKYMYVPYMLYKKIFENQKKIWTKLYFEHDISVESFISYICDVVDQNNQLNLTFCDEKYIEKYAISKYNNLKKYKIYLYPSALCPEKFRLFEIMLSKYKKYSDDIIKEYCNSELSSNLYLIDRRYNLSKQYLDNKELYIERGKIYSVLSLSKYKFVYTNSEVIGMKYCFNINIIDDMIYIKGPFKVDGNDLYYKNKWNALDNEFVFMEQQKYIEGSVCVFHGINSIEFRTNAYEYILDMQCNSSYQNGCVESNIHDNNIIKLKIQDNNIDDYYIYVSKNILLNIDNEYFQLATDPYYIKQYGDCEPSIYFCENQTIHGFLDFLEHYLNNINANNTKNIIININSIHDINMYTYYHRFNINNILKLHSQLKKSEIIKMLHICGFDSNSEIYDLILKSTHL